MEYVSYIIAPIIVICAVIFSIINYKYWKKRSQDEIQSNKNQEYNEEKSQVLEQIYSEIQESLAKLSSVNKEIEQKQIFNSSLLKVREDELDNLIEEKRKFKEAALRLEIDDWSKSAQEAANFERDQILAEYQIQCNEAYEDLRQLWMEVNEYKEKRDTLNQEILRSRALEEKQDFYCVQIPENYKRDISILNDIRSEISKVDILDKLIYDNYVKKSVDEMIKRVLEGKSPCGIYKITRLKTGEIYIGKSTDIKSRWQQHCKSCYHCGTISHSNLHTTMEKDGLWGFTFELLEEVPKDKLTEREKYWINFYDSKNYGLNQREG